MTKTEKPIGAWVHFVSGWQQEQYRDYHGPFHYEARAPIINVSHKNGEVFQYKIRIDCDRQCEMWVNPGEVEAVTDGVD